MTVALLICYLAGLACELGGARLVIKGVLSDARDLRNLLEAQEQTEQLQEFQPAPGITVSGPGAAIPMRGAIRSQRLEQFVLSRLDEGHRWTGVGLLLAGILLNAAGNIASLFA